MNDMISKKINVVYKLADRNTPQAIRLCKDLGHTLGFAHVAELTPEKHDDMIAYLSQLTHCIAVSLMTCSDVPQLKEYTGDSFRDLTRIAKINEDMWTELFLLNKKPLISMIDEFSGELYRLRTYIADDNVEKLKEMIEKHVKYTGSEKGQRVLDDFENYVGKFKKIIPNDYKEILHLTAQFEEQGMSHEQAQIEAFTELVG